MDATSDSNRFLSFNRPILRNNNLDQLISMWSVLSKCKQHLEDGPRLENLSWRLWHQKQQQHFVQPILSLSAGDDCHEVSQKKQTQHDQVSEKKEWSFSTSSKPLVKINHQHHRTSTPSSTISHSDIQHHNSSRTTTPSLSDSYQCEDEYDDDLYDDDDDFYDDDLYDDDIYDDDDYGEDIYHERPLMHNRYKEKLRSHPTSNQHYFEKKSLPPRQPLIQRPSLLSALFKTPPNSSSSSSSSNSIHTPPPPDHFLKKELTESLRNNVLWEHAQQKPGNHHQRQHRAYYYYRSPPSSAYHPPPLPTHRSSNRPPAFNNNKKTRLPPDQGWLESFHGW